MRIDDAGRPIDLARTLFPLQRGAGDPTTRVDGRVAWRTARTAEGPATIRLEQLGIARIRIETWGPGAAAALDRAPALAGIPDDDTGFDPAVGGHAAVVEAARRFAGVRLTRTPDVMPVLLAAICEQKVTGSEARRGWRGLVRATSEPAPAAPDAPPLLLPPDPARVAALSYVAFHGFGLPQRRAAILKDVASRPLRVERLGEGPPAEARAWLELVPGIGPWTSAETARLALGDPDAVSVGDFHLPNLVAWALAGEARATDARMLELLEPYRGHRGRVQRLLEATGVLAPKFGPRMEIRSIERI
jgi:3-methyladenine DNA glycosylase/8-oxoguanine DNA glycosylase